MIETVFDRDVRSTLTDRIGALHVGLSPVWGKMNVERMAEHCVNWNQWVHGRSELRLKQSLVGKLIGRWVLRWTLRPGRPLDRGIPAGPAHTVERATRGLESLKCEWIELMGAYATYDNPDFVHDFFGKMSGAELGVFVYKHMDHHLRQFGV